MGEPLPSQRCSNMAVFFALLVVVIHVGGPPDPLRPIGWFLWQGCRLSCVAVPSFFLLSGYFLGKHIDESGWYGRSVGKRVKTLLVPFVTWNLVCVLSFIANRWTFLGSGKVFEDLALTSGAWWFTVLGLDLTRHPFLQPLWFVRALFVLVVASPLLVLAVRKCCKVTLAIAAALLALKTHDSSGSTWYFLFNTLGVGWVLFFLLGMLIRMGRISLLPARWAAISVMVGLGLLYGFPTLSTSFSLSPEWVSLLSGKVAPVCLLLGALTLFPDWRLPCAVTGLSIPIYFIHWMVLDFYRLRIDWRYSSTTQFVFRLVFAIVVSVVMAGALRALLPRRVKSFLLGGR